MGIWTTLVGSAQEANEQAHGERLRRELESTLSLMDGMNEEVRAYAILKFMEKRSTLKLNMANWSREGRIKVARALHASARKKFDLDQAESYALWLAGAWLESGARNSPQAEYVNNYIETFAKQLDDT